MKQSFASTVLFIVSSILPVACRAPGITQSPAQTAQAAEIYRLRSIDRRIDAEARPFVAQSPAAAKSELGLLITPVLLAGKNGALTPYQRTHNAMIMHVAQGVAEEMRRSGTYDYIAVTPSHSLPTGAADFVVKLSGSIDERNGMNVDIKLAPGWLSNTRGAAVKSFANARWKRDSDKYGEPLSELVGECKDGIAALIKGWPLDAESGWAMQTRCYGVGRPPEGPLPQAGPKTKAVVQKLSAAERKAFLDPYQLQVAAISERVQPALEQYCSAMREITLEKERIARRENEARERASEARNQALVGGLMSTLQSGASNFNNPVAFQADAAMIQLQYGSDVDQVNQDLDTVLDANKEAMEALSGAAQGISTETGAAVKSVQIEFDGEQVELQGGSVFEQMKSFREFATKKLEQAIKEDALAR